MIKSFNCNNSKLTLEGKESCQMIKTNLLQETDLAILKNKNSNEKDKAELILSFRNNEIQNLSNAADACGLDNVNILNPKCQKNIKNLNCYNPILEDKEKNACLTIKERWIKDTATAMEKSKNKEFGKFSTILDICMKKPESILGSKCQNAIAKVNCKNRSINPEGVEVCNEIKSYWELAVRQAKLNVENNNEIEELVTKLRAEEIEKLSKTADACGVDNQNILAPNCQKSIAELNCENQLFEEREKEICNEIKTRWEQDSDAAYKVLSVEKHTTCPKNTEPTGSSHLQDLKQLLSLNCSTQSTQKSDDPLVNLTKHMCEIMRSAKK
jgi:hypothetical protein